MPTVKLIGGFADGSITYVADDQNEIYVPRQWGRQDHQGTVSRAVLNNASDREKYIRSGRYDHEGTPLFIAESAGGLLG